MNIRILLCYTLCLSFPNEIVEKILKESIYKYKGKLYNKIDLYYVKCKICKERLGRKGSNIYIIKIPDCKLYCMKCKKKIEKYKREDKIYRYFKTENTKKCYKEGRKQAYRPSNMQYYSDKNYNILSL